VENCLLRGLRYANLSLTHSLNYSDVDTFCNKLGQTRAPEPSKTTQIDFVILEVDLGEGGLKLLSN